MAIETLTDSEMETLQRGATGAGLLVAVSDRGFFDTFKEAGAMGKHLAEARKNSDSPLVRQLAETRGTGFGLTASPDEIESGTLEALQAASRVLQGKAPQEIDAYRRFVLDLARSVSSAAGGGEDTEREAIGKIERALDTP